MPRKKHRLVIEVTFSRPVTAKEAAQGTSLVLDERLDLQAKPVWASEPTIYIDKISRPKEFSRVIRGLERSNG